MSKPSNNIELSIPNFNTDYLPKGLSVVIPNYNGTKLFPRTLPPLLNVLAQLTIPVEVLLIDDCSTDGSIAYVQNHHPEIKILTNEVNSGFSKTVNNGIFASRYELIFLLNSDIILTPGYFEKQFKYFSEKSTFGVMGRIIGWDDEFIQDAARYPLRHGAKIKTSCLYLPQSADAGSLFTLYLSGANALISREKLVALGGLDELFSPYYAEDCELSFRAWRLGWRCYYEHDAVCRHRTSSTIQTSSRKKDVEIIYYRNKIFLHAIHLPAASFFIYFTQLLIEALFRMITLRVSLTLAIIRFIKLRKYCGQSRERFESVSRDYRASSLSKMLQQIKKQIDSLPVNKFKPGQRT